VLIDHLPSEHRFSQLRFFSFTTSWCVLDVIDRVCNVSICLLDEIDMDSIFLYGLQPKYDQLERCIWFDRYAIASGLRSDHIDGTRIYQLNVEIESNTSQSELIAPDRQRMVWMLISVQFMVSRRVVSWKLLHWSEFHGTIETNTYESSHVIDARRGIVRWMN